MKKTLLTKTVITGLSIELNENDINQLISIRDMLTSPNNLHGHAVRDMYGTCIAIIDNILKDTAYEQTKRAKQEVPCMV